jgi:hypothetical protein
LNPVLPLLLLLSLAGFLVLRGRGGIAWAVCGLAAIALFAPALRLPDGVPSPAATLALDPPWQAVARPEVGNPAQGDVTYQVIPWLLFLRHELRAGRAPYWNPHQSAGTPFWGNGSSAPLFPLHLLFVAVPLQVGFLLLPWLRIVIGGCGVWALARELGLSRPAALLTALAFPLSGMPVGFLLYPMGNALALVPWVLLATERLAMKRWGWAPLALLGGLQLLAGHPETALHTAMLSGLYLLVRGTAVRAWAGWFAGWAVAAAISAIHILPLALTLFASSRWQQWSAAADVSPPLALLALQPLRLVLPEMYGNPALGTWWGPFNYLATAVYAGALALPLAAAGMVRARGDRRWAAVLVLLLFSLAAAYHLPVLRQVLLALPLVGRVLHHRLLFGVELALALLLGAGCDRWLEGKAKALLAGTAAALALLGAAWLAFAGEWSGRGLTGQQLRWTLWVGGIAVLLAASLALRRERRWRVWPLLPGILLIDLVAAHGRVNPAQPLGRIYPRTGAIEFLADRPERLAGLGNTLRPNAAMAYGLFDVRGDDSVKLQRYERLYASRLGEGHPTYFRPMSRWRDVWLARLGVRWVVAGPREEPPVPGWTLAYQGPDARVYERPRPLPLVRWAGGGAGRMAEVERRAPGAWDVSWRAARPGLLVVAEAWDPGWRATVDGKAVPVEPAGDVLLGLHLGPGQGRLRLRYRPPGLLPGAALSLLGLAAAGAAWWLRRPRRPA